MPGHRPPSSTTSARSETLKIYTKTGDGGETSLLGGERVAKDHPRVAACGDVDELNAALGGVRADAPGTDLARLLLGVQRDLFAIGARLADPNDERASKRAKAAIPATRVRRLERAIDRLEAKLPPLRAFVLPAGTPTAAALHRARAVCRRAERSIVGLSHDAEVNPRIVVYVNRLSDLLFLLARHENFGAGRDEEPW